MFRSFLCCVITNLLCKRKGLFSFEWKRRLHLLFKHSSLMWNTLLGYGRRAWYLKYAIILMTDCLNYSHTCFYKPIYCNASLWWMQLNRWMYLSFVWFIYRITAFDVIGYIRLYRDNKRIEERFRWDSPCLMSHIFLLQVEVIVFCIWQHNWKNLSKHFSFAAPSNSVVESIVVYSVPHDVAEYEFGRRYSFVIFFSYP